MEKDTFDYESTSPDRIEQCHALLDNWLDQFQEQSSTEPLEQSKFLLMENHLRAVVDNMETLADIAEVSEEDKAIAVFIATMHDKSRLTQALIGDEDSKDQINGRPHAAMSAIQALGKGKAHEMLQDKLWGLSEDDARWETIMNGVGQGIAYELFPDLTEGDETWGCLFHGISLHMYPKDGVELSDLDYLTDRERFFLDLTVNADAAANLSHKFTDPDLTEHLMIVNGHTLDELINSQISPDVLRHALEKNAPIDYKIITHDNRNQNAADWFVAWMLHVHGVTSPDVAAALLDKGSLATMAEIVDYTDADTRAQMQQVSAKCIAHLEKVKAQKYPEEFPSSFNAPLPQSA
ncbi:hypothetical protein FWF89_01830 [Candidatus Saccharibacteria bacterium]|nr:hypothetical protein [Candidatus Saccharibacteria bacterium]